MAVTEPTPEEKKREEELANETIAIKDELRRTEADPRIRARRRRVARERTSAACRPAADADGPSGRSTSDHD